MTAGNVGPSSVTPLRAPLPAIQSPQEPWSPRIPVFAESCALSTSPARKAASPWKGAAIKTSALEAAFARLLHAYHLPDYVREFRFHPVRKWRLDFAWPDQKVGVELQGGIFTGGRHSGGVGQLSDMEKLNEAQTMGWTILQFAAPHLRDGTAVAMTKRALGL